MLQQVFASLEFDLVAAAENWLNDIYIYIYKASSIDDNFRKSHHLRAKKQCSVY